MTYGLACPLRDAPHEHAMLSDSSLVSHTISAHCARKLKDIAYMNTLSSNRYHAHALAEKCGERLSRVNHSSSRENVRACQEL